MTIETLGDWNTALACCCKMPDFNAPVIDGEHFYIVQTPCHQRSIVYNGITYYYKKYEESLVIEHTNTSGVDENFTTFESEGRTWNAATLSCDVDTPVSTVEGSVVCPFATTSDVDSEIGVPPGDFIERNVELREQPPPHNYVRTREFRYKEGYTMPDDLRSEADDVAADKVENETFNLSTFKSDYTFDASSVSIREGRFRWDLSNHEGSWFKITWDIAFYPEGGGAATPFLQDQVYEWTGVIGGPTPGNEENWFSPWYLVKAPLVKGEYRIVNIRYSGYRTPYGTPIKTVGESEDYT